MTVSVYKSGKETPAEQLSSYLHQIADHVKVEMDKQSNILFGVNKKPETIKQIGSTFGSMMSSIDSYYSNLYSNTVKTIIGIENAVKKAKDILEKKKADCIKMHEENLPLIEVNEKIQYSMSKFMESIGIPRTYSTWEYPTSRSRSTKERKHTAGWVTDMERVVKTDDCYSLAMKAYDKYVIQIDNYEKTEIKK